MFTRLILDNLTNDGYIIYRAKLLKRIRGKSKVIKYLGSIKRKGRKFDSSSKINIILNLMHYLINAILLKEVTPDEVLKFVKRKKRGINFIYFTDRERLQFRRLYRLFLRYIDNIEEMDIIRERNIYLKASKK